MDEGEAGNVWEAVYTTPVLLTAVTKRTEEPRGATEETYGAWDRAYVACEEVRVAFRKTTLVDYPGKVAAALFFPGCNLRCPWCHNGALVTREDTEALVPLEEALAVIEKRRSVLSGVTLSGGEPTLYPGLEDLIRRIKALGLAVKLDTNGMLPDVLDALLKKSATRPDYIAMDLKLAPERYAELLPQGRARKRAQDVPAPHMSEAGESAAEREPEYAVPSSNEEAVAAACAIRESAALVRSSGVEHEFRSLDLPGGYITGADKRAMSALAGNSRWVWRPFLGGSCLDEAWNNLSPLGSQTL